MTNLTYKYFELKPNLSIRALAYTIFAIPILTQPLSAQTSPYTPQPLPEHTDTQNRKNKHLTLDSSDPSSNYFSIGDTVKVVVENVDSVTGEYSIDEFGIAEFPYIGPLKVEGASPEELTSTLKDLYGKDMLRDPQISVTLIARDIPEPAIQPPTPFGKFMIDGQISAPGIYPLQDAEPFTKVLSAAGGILIEADQDRIIVLRRTAQGSLKTYLINYTAILKGVNPDPLIIPSDFIYVKRAEERFELDQINQVLALLEMPIKELFGSK